MFNAQCLVVSSSISSIYCFGVSFHSMSERFPCSRILSCSFTTSQLSTLACRSDTCVAEYMYEWRGLIKIHENTFPSSREKHLTLTELRKLKLSSARVLVAFVLVPSYLGVVYGAYPNRLRLTMQRSTAILAFDMMHCQWRRVYS
jgi:hypothetical protein